MKKVGYSFLYYCAKNKFEYIVLLLWLIFKIKTGNVFQSFLIIFARHKVISYVELFVLPLLAVLVMTFNQASVQGLHNLLLIQ